MLGEGIGVEDIFATDAVLIRSEYCLANWGTVTQLSFGFEV